MTGVGAEGLPVEVTVFCPYWRGSMVYLGQNPQR